MATKLRIYYEDRRGRLRGILVACSELHFVIDHVGVERAGAEDGIREEAHDLADLEGTNSDMPGEGAVVLHMQVRGRKSITELVARLSDINGVIKVGTVEDEDLD